MGLDPEPHGHDACVGARVAAQELLMQVVSAGLGGKLFLEAIPELRTVMNSMDRLLEVGVHDPMSLAQAWLLLRGIRGARGVRWLADWLEEHTLLWTRVWSISVVSFLYRSFQELCRTHEDGSGNWACHNEGRHAGLCGRHFLLALCTDAGTAGLAEAVGPVSAIIQRCQSKGGRARSSSSKRSSTQEEAYLGVPFFLVTLG